ncbi:MAG TPA: transketolase [Gemmataceae bacterium]|nr:transketolase [Gemmataceae bacterium]
MPATSPSPALAELQAKARNIRKGIITSTTTAGSGHPTSSLSGVEIAVALYFGGILRYDPKNPQWPQRDRFILSKGHAAPLLYAVLAEAGYFSPDLLPSLRKLGSPLEGHPNMRRLPGVEASTGSLGQGLSIGIGHALAARLDGRDSRVYVLLGDGEINEGQVWEAAMAAAKFKLDNLVAIIDQNGYQQTGPTAEVLDLRPLAPRWQAFGWFVQEINGHDLNEVLAAFHQAAQTKGRPSVIIAHTIKGYPIQGLLSSDPNHHGKPLTPAEAEKALAMLG